MGDQDAAPGPRLFVLLAEDDPDVAEQFRVWLWSRYNVAIARDGFDALRQARQHRPDVVLLDIVMPTLHGTTVAWILRNDPRYDEVPIVLFSGRTAADTGIELVDEVATWADAVADVRVGKPRSQEELEGALTQALLVRRRRERPERILVPRFDVLLTATLGTDGVEMPAQVLSLSLSGAFVECPTPPPPGAPVTLSFELGGARFALSGHVLHEGQLRESPGIGVRFSPLTLEEETRLIRGLATILKK